jgi:signal transduction histidine kinase
MKLVIDPLPELLVWGDQRSLTRMVMNLVDNALTHGAVGGTHVRLAGGRRPHDDVPGVWLEVADDGPGIAAEHLPHLGERFYRVDRARTHSARAARKEHDAGAVARGEWLGAGHQPVDCRRTRGHPRH